MECLFFSYFMIRNCNSLSLNSGHFDASEDIITKFRLQVLHITRIKYWNAGGSDNPPSFNPTLLIIGILLCEPDQTFWAGVQELNFDFKWVLSPLWNATSHKHLVPPSLSCGLTTCLIAIVSNFYYHIWTRYVSCCSWKNIFSGDKGKQAYIVYTLKKKNGK
jgi:hypothetical protein